MGKDVVTVKNLSKMYKLYSNGKDRIRDALSPGGKKRYKEHYALRDINFTIGQGETVGIIGTNGSGKSTILKLITGLLTPTEGEIRVDGRISALLELGAGFNPEYTGIENIYLNGTLLGYSKEEMKTKIDDIVDFADIGDYVNQPVKTYSSGMFVRLAFAVAINIDPEVLIIDEALSVGDIFFQSKCFRKFEEFKNNGKTILFVSHDLGSIMRYCDKVVLLNKGHMVKMGDPKEIIDIYKKILVNQYDEDDDDYGNAEGTSLEQLAAMAKDDGIVLWRDNFGVNPTVLDYGDRRAEIFDFCVTDSKGIITNSVEKNGIFNIKVRVRFHEAADDPIFAYSFKDRMGNELTGTNTLFEKSDVGHVEAGEVVEVTFTQRMTLCSGEYLVSLGCTNYEGVDFVVYHRLYDAFNVTVVSHKDSVGFFDLNSEIEVKRIVKSDGTDV